MVVSAAPGVSRTSLGEAVQALQAEANGVLSAEVITPETFADLLTEARGGSQEALALARAAVDAIRWASQCPENAPALCGCCPRPVLSGRFSIAIAHTDFSTGGSGNALGVLICGECEQLPEGLLGAAQAALQRIWPDARQVTLHPDSGHA